MATAVQKDSIWKRLQEQTEALNATERNLTKALDDLLSEEDKARERSDERKIRIKYTNYRGETSERTIIPHERELRFGANQWHTTPQWLLPAFDVDKKEDREFALKDIQYIQ